MNAPIRANGNSIPPCRAYFLAGCTATGKSEVAHRIALREGWPLLSADAMLVYRGMDIGTAKPSAAARSAFDYHGLDCVDPGDSFSVGDWMREAERACRQTAGSGRPLLVVGGSGLYMKRLLTGLHAPASDPDRRQYWIEQYRREGLHSLRRKLAATAPALAGGLADAGNPRRLIRALEMAESGMSVPPDPEPVESLPWIAGLRMPRERLQRRIAARVETMWASGLLDEIRRLRYHVPSWSPTAEQAIGYREALEVLDGTSTENRARERMVVRTRQLAKRQETWFRNQLRVNWIDVADGESRASVADRVRAYWRQHGPIEIPFERFRAVRR